MPELVPGIARRCRKTSSCATRQCGCVAAARTGNDAVAGREPAQQAHGLHVGLRCVHARLRRVGCVTGGVGARSTGTENPLDAQLQTRFAQLVDAHFGPVEGTQLFFSRKRCNGGYAMRPGTVRSAKAAVCWAIRSPGDELTGAPFFLRFSLSNTVSGMEVPIEVLRAAPQYAASLRATHGWTRLRRLSAEPGHRGRAQAPLEQRAAAAPQHHSARGAGRRENRPQSGTCRPRAPARRLRPALTPRGAPRRSASRCARRATPTTRRSQRSPSAPRAPQRKPDGAGVEQTDSLISAQPQARALQGRAPRG
jgi:hypothetical protein